MPDLPEPPDQPDPLDSLNPNDPHVLPLAEEQVRIEKRVRQKARVRVQTIVREEPCEIAETLSGTEVEVTRVAVDRLVDAPVADRTDGDTLVVSLHREILVVQRRLQVFEELHIKRRERQHVHAETVTLRREDVLVERDETPATDMSTTQG